MNEKELFQFAPGRQAGKAPLSLDLSAVSGERVSPLLFGKFCEHLGYNIYRGMEAQILYNPTFGAMKVPDEAVARLTERMGWNVGAACRHGDSPGATCRSSSISAAAGSVEEEKRQVLGTPYGDVAATLLADYRDGAALGWFRVGTKEQVRLSPDAAPNRCFAQRVETPGATPAAPVGIGQWTYLPLHRTRGCQWRLVARAVEPARVRLAIFAAEASDKPLAETTVELTPEWQTLTGRLDVPAEGRDTGILPVRDMGILPMSSPQNSGEPTAGTAVGRTGETPVSRSAADPHALFLFTITTDRPANLVLGRVLLYPDDHVNGADPEIVTMLKDARLPLLRWPGGNFVSAYHWRDGVGPVDQRPTMPNPVWSGVFESNLFGTDEFVAYCQAVGCAPMICVNAGGGTAEEAAEWVQYCNGPADSPMGRLRAANGHPGPFGVKYWEIGNEIFGRHQVGWTTPAGNVDRFLRFRRAMLAADPTLRILACGGLHQGVDAEWNRRLNEDTAGLADCQTHHILEGGTVDETADVKELYHAFMGYPVRIAADYRLARRRMQEAGIRDPRLAITELQLFASYQGKTREGCPLPGRLPTPGTISEALYFMLIAHECIRLGDFVEMITHSATVNHGGGLRKDRERVWGNPVHYAHAMAAALAGGRRVGVRLSCGTFSTAHEFGHLPVVADCPDLDALAVRHDDGSLVLMLVHRSAAAGPVELTIDLGGLRASGRAETLTLSGRSLDDENTLNDRQRVVPRPGTAEIKDGKIHLVLPPYSLTRVTVPAA